MAVRRPPVAITCLHCQTTVLKPANRVGRAKYCSKVCKDAKKRAEIVVSCEVCGRTLIFTPSRMAKGGRFCSKRCEGEGRQGVPRKERITLRCEQCRQTFLRLPSLSKNKGRLIRFCSYSCYRLYRGETGPEKCVREALDALQIPYEQEYKVRRYSIDFYLSLRGVALEVDGDYWHGMPAAIERDRRRDAYLLRRGIQTVRLKETEIRAAPDLSQLVAQRLKV
jgi:very-short-patch-repair endonuclease/ribosomal protein S27E